ncbi:hypothetical protein N7517_008245 [Penicillium concentricum]|uniref:Uncharacterized protein n=1 Tax=Penicillium concentricum TaxID=293559 RepID=A0A9W9RUP6_9EURO|nr:uncharacterized protein N7517_008245 [Penicillium concentricum]KAJ5365359.1 hypothetical protein N7517_008245 [Penicillium concentricum]
MAKKRSNVGKEAAPTSNPAAQMYEFWKPSFLILGEPAVDAWKIWILAGEIDPAVAELMKPFGFRLERKD